MEYFSAEDVPLLSEYPQNHHHLDVHHGDFDVAAFPDTPLLPDVTEVHDDDFSDFVQSPTSEIPPSRKIADGDIDASEKKLSELLTVEYIQHVAIIILVQLLIPIPFMVPMSINFVKRALRVFLPGFAIGLVGHGIVNFLFALPSARPLSPDSFHHISQHLPASSAFLPALFTQLKIAALGGIVVGAVMAHVLNFFILGHTVCRLARGLEPEPTAMRRAMDASKTFQRAQRVVLDLITALAVFPAGIAARQWLFSLWGGSPSAVGIAVWHSEVIGVAGVAAIQLMLLARRRWSSSQPQGGTGGVHVRTKRTPVSDRRKALVSL